MLDVRKRLCYEDISVSDQTIRVKDILISES
jgi:hypothetical protein